MTWSCKTKKAVTRLATLLERVGCSFFIKVKLIYFLILLTVLSCFYVGDDVKIVKGGSPSSYFECFFLCQCVILAENRT